MMDVTIHIMNNLRMLVMIIVKQTSPTIYQTLSVANIMSMVPSFIIKKGTYVLEIKFISKIFTVFSITFTAWPLFTF
jgi:hypothetical protein